MTRYRIFPGSMAAADIAVKLFGYDRVDPGTWLTPVYVNSVTDEEFLAARSLLEEHGLKIEKEW